MEAKIRKIKLVCDLLEVFVHCAPTERSAEFVGKYQFFVVVPRSTGAQEMCIRDRLLADTYCKCSCMKNCIFKRETLKMR